MVGQEAAPTATYMHARCQTQRNVLPTGAVPAAARASGWLVVMMMLVRGSGRRWFAPRPGELSRRTGNNDASDKILN